MHFSLELFGTYPAFPRGAEGVGARATDCEVYVGPSSSVDVFFLVGLG